MKLSTKKYFLALFFLLFSLGASARMIYLGQYFVNKAGCFLLFNLNQNKLIVAYNPIYCAKQIPADSTFKIPLSLMAFDQKLITQKTIFKWDGKSKGLPVWEQNQTPHTWLKYSVVWVSQRLTPQLGIHKIQDYLQKFNYGNKDFSGDSGLNNGLTHAWLSSSLKISANEQLAFLKALVTNSLPVSKPAMIQTRRNMYLETAASGWRLYGKTGTGNTQPTPGEFVQGKPQDGWFVGFVKRGEQTYLFVLNFSDLLPPKTPLLAGMQAREMTESILNRMGIF